MLWTLGWGMNIGDVVMCPDAKGDFMFGEVASDYYCEPDDILPQRRRVKWHPGRTKRSEISEALKRSTNGPGTIVVVDEYYEEIERLLGSDAVPSIVATSEVIEQPADDRTHDEQKTMESKDMADDPDLYAIKHFSL